jgi:hypothetical protein
VPYTTTGTDNFPRLITDVFRGWLLVLAAMGIPQCDNRAIDRSLRLFWNDWMVGQALGVTSMGLTGRGGVALDSRRLVVQWYKEDGQHYCSSLCCLESSGISTRIMIPTTLILLLATLGATGSPVEYAPSCLCHHKWLTIIRPRAADGLNARAVAAGKQYFGSATDNSELSDSAYVAGLSNTADFGQITPGNSMKVRSISYQQRIDLTPAVGHHRALPRNFQLRERRCDSKSCC